MGPEGSRYYNRKVPNSTSPPRKPRINSTSSNIGLNLHIMSDTTAANKVRQKPAEIVDDAYDYLVEEDIAWMIKHFKELDPEEKGHLLAYMKELEKRDPVKMRRLKSRVHRK